MQTTYMDKARAARRRGFTLLELLVVVAILAIVAGGLIAAYDGLEQKAAEGVSTYSIGALDNVIRQHKATNAGQYPNHWDSLLFTDPATTGAFEALNILPPSLKGKIGKKAIPAAGIAALNNVGINSVRYIDTPNGEEGPYDNAATPTQGGTGTQPEIPNRVFDDPVEKGWSAIGSTPLAADSTLAVVESGDIPSFTDGSAPGNSNRLNEYFGLDSTAAHVVVAFGVGNKSTLVQTSAGRFDARAASLSQAPYYQKAKPTEYGRYLACFHLGSSPSGDATSASVSYFENARFLGVIDTKGDFFEEEAAEFTGVKQ